MNKIYFKNIRKEIKTLLADSKYEVKIAVAWFSDKSLILELEKCLKRGVDVSIIFYDKSNDKELFKKLYKQNAKIATTSKLMHNKFCVIDNETVINGSYNWTNSASRNHENIQVTFSEKTAEIFSKEYNNILRSPTTSYVKIDNYFIDKEKAFQEYFAKQIKPNNFPVLYKQELTSNLKYELEKYNYYVRDNIPFNYFYVYIENIEAYINFHRRLIEKPFEGENPFLFGLLSSHIKPSHKESKNFFLIVDFVMDKPLKSISQKNYDEGELSFYSEKIFNLNDYRKENFLLIGLSEFERTRNLKSYELEVILVSCKEFRLRERLGYLEYGDITITENEVLFGGGFATVFCGDISYDAFDKKIYYDKVINKKDYQINIERSNENKENAISKKRNDEINKFKKLKQKKEEIRNSKDCYIATMVYRSPNHPNIIKLRKFRNRVLLNYEIGFFIVKIYYKISPIFVKSFNDNKIVKNMAKFIIEKIIFIIDKTKFKNII